MVLFLYIAGGIIGIVGAWFTIEGLASAGELRALDFDEGLVNLVTGSVAITGVSMIVTGTVIAAIGRILDILLRMRRDQLRSDRGVESFDEDDLDTSNAVLRKTSDPPLN